MHFLQRWQKENRERTTIVTARSAWPESILVLIVSAEVLKLSEGDPSEEVATDLGPVLKYDYSAL